MKTYALEDLQPWSHWLHTKTMSWYTVLGLSRSSTNGREGELCVVYVSHSRGGGMHHRQWQEFLDGRFTKEGDC